MIAFDKNIMHSRLDYCHLRLFFKYLLDAALFSPLPLPHALTCSSLLSLNKEAKAERGGTGGGRARQRARQRGKYGQGEGEGEKRSCNLLLQNSVLTSQTLNLNTSINSIQALVTPGHLKKKKRYLKMCWQSLCDKGHVSLSCGLVWGEDSWLEPMWH